MLLEKGANITELTCDRENCLDIAISRDHDEVVKVLLNHQHWRSLITFESDENIILNKNDENRQLLSLYDKKMWEAFELILDKCVTKKGYDFGILDRSVLSTVHHPLMLIARSGEEKLIKHEATIKLLNLKWRFLPRFFFYSNLFIRTIFLVLMGIFAYLMSESTCTCSVELCQSVSPTTSFQNYSRIFFNAVSSNQTGLNTSTVLIDSNCTYIADKNLNRLSIGCNVYPLINSNFNLITFSISSQLIRREIFLKHNRFIFNS